MTGHDAEQVAAAINKLANNMRATRALLSDEVIILVLAHRTGVGAKTLKRVLNEIERMPSFALTPAGRAIRIREDEDDDDL